MTESLAPPIALDLPLTKSLPLPFGLAAQLLRQELLDCLHRLDECGLVRCLVRASHDLSPAERPSACWLPCTVGLEECRHAGHELDGSRTILRFLRESARSMLEKFPLAVQGLWLIPAESDDTTAAHLAALMMAHRGCLARPWVWPFLPRTGEFMLVGTTRECERHPHHAHYRGQTTLIAECHTYTAHLHAIEAGHKPAQIAKAG